MRVVRWEHLKVEYSVALLAHSTADTLVEKRVEHLADATVVMRVVPMVEH